MTCSPCPDTQLDPHRVRCGAWAIHDNAPRAPDVHAARPGPAPVIARSGVTVTRLRLGPLPVQNVLQLPHAGNSGRHSVVDFILKTKRGKCRPYCPACGTDRAVAYAPDRIQ
jgi:hypothetical protein